MNLRDMNLFIVAPHSGLMLTLFPTVFLFLVVQASQVTKSRDNAAYGRRVCLDEIHGHPDK